MIIVHQEETEGHDLDHMKGVQELMIIVDIEEEAEVIAPEEGIIGPLPEEKEEADLDYFDTLIIIP